MTPSLFTAYWDMCSLHVEIVITDEIWHGQPPGKTWFYPGRRLRIQCCGLNISLSVPHRAVCEGFVSRVLGYCLMG